MYGALIKLKDVSDADLNSKELSDLVEALLGALLMSEDFDSRGARAMFNNVLKPFFDRYSRPDSTGEHPANALSVVFQKRKCENFRNSLQESITWGVKSYTRSGTHLSGFVGRRLQRCDPICVLQSSSTTSF